MEDEILELPQEDIDRAEGDAFVNKEDVFDKPMRAEVIAFGKCKSKNAEDYEYTLKVKNEKGMNCDINYVWLSHIRMVIKTWKQPKDWKGKMVLISSQLNSKGYKNWFIIPAP